MSRYLLTQSLLNSWLYLYKVNENFADSVYKDFLDVLYRKDRLPSKAMQAGIDFENMVTAAANGAKVKSEAANKVADIVRGGQTQVALYQRKTIYCIDFLLYGRLDYLKAGTIYDVKFVIREGNYEAGKYVDAIQHPFYFELLPEANQFDYLISDGIDVFTESYRRESVESIDWTVSEFIDFLRVHKLLEVYYEKWAARS